MTTKIGDPPVTGYAPPGSGLARQEGPRLPVARWFLLVWLGAAIILLANDPGRMVFDTKLPVDIDPAWFLTSLWSLWNPLNTLGSLNNQAIGYAVPMAPFYLAAELVHLPVWVTERLWMSLIIAVGFTGIVRLATALGIGSPPARFLAGLVFALWPTFSIVIGSTSAAVLPGMIVPWAVLPLISAAPSGAHGWRRAAVAAARSGVAVACMGGVNATSTIDVLLLPGLFILTHARGRQLVRLCTCWAMAVVGATAWWFLPLLLQGKYAFNFLPYVEQAAATTDTTSASATLRGVGDWVAYVNFGSPYLPAGWALVTVPVAIMGSVLAAGGGLYGLALRKMPEAVWLRLSAGAAMAGVLAGYYGPVSGPFSRTVQNLLNGPLAPFRNVYKLEPVVATVLVLGLAHATAEWVRKDPHREQFPQAIAIAVRVLAGVVLAGLLVPFVSGRILNPGPFSAVPSYWNQLATFLASKSPDNPALVVPSDAHGQYLWGDPVDDPLVALSRSPTAEYALVPYGGAGGQVMLSTVETAVESGEQVSGLTAYLARAGVRYLVVRNDLAPQQFGYVAPVIVHQTLALSGFVRVASFGPQITGAQTDPQAPSQEQSAEPSYPAIEVFTAAGSGASQPLSPVTTLPVSQTVLVNGGPDSLLQLAGQKLLGADQPAIIAGDPLPTAPTQWDVTDGQRRADELFGVVNNNVSYTYTATETNPPDFQLGAGGEQPQQILPVPAAGHQTVAVLSGAAQVTVSSYGSWVAETPQEDPVNAFDGNPATAWAEGDVNTPVGQWIQITFDQPMDLPSRIAIQLLDDSTDREIAAQLRVSTAAGSTLTDVGPTGAMQQVNVVPGRTSWLRITFTAARRVVPGGPGAGISDVLIPGVTVTKLLEPAEDPRGYQAPSVSFSFDQQIPSPVTFASPAAVPAMARIFTVPSPVSLQLRASALALPGSGLDALIDSMARPAKGTLQVSAASAAGLLPTQFPASLFNGSSVSSGLPWLADSTSPVIHLSWHGKRRISSMIVLGADGVASVPQTVEITSPAGTRIGTIGFAGEVEFSRPLTTDRMDISFPSVQQAITNNSYGQTVPLPLGLSRIAVPALANLRVVPPDAAARFFLGCGKGPALTIDGQAYRTSVSGTIGELTQFRPVQVRLCAPDGTLTLAAGQHTLIAQTPGTFAVTSLSLSDAPTTNPATVPYAGSRTVTVSSWQSDQRELSVGPGTAAYLEVHENYNVGWTAALNGRTLTPVRLDGWQQAFVVPAGPGGTVVLRYQPARIYHIALLASIASILFLLAVAIWPVLRRIWRRSWRRSLRRYWHRLGPGPRQAAAWTTQKVATPERETTRATAGWWLGILAVTALMVVAGGLAALAVPVLACLAYWRPRWLPPLALAGMIASGLVTATARSQPQGTHLLGTFSGPAQVCALIALAAALIPAVWRPEGESGQ
jgi:arabinofuranan 3-O-arabinosyltransferase